MALEVNTQWIEDALIEEELAHVQAVYKNNNPTKMPSRADLLPLVKENLIRRALLRQEAAKQDYKPNAQELESAYQMWIAENPILLGNDGEKEKILQHISSSMQVSRLLENVVKDIKPITNSHVEHFFEDNRQSYDFEKYFRLIEVWVNAEMENAQARALYLHSFVGEMCKKKSEGSLNKNDSQDKNDSKEHCIERIISDISEKASRSLESKVSGQTAFCINDLKWANQKTLEKLTEEDAIALAESTKKTSIVRRYANGYAFYCVLDIEVGSRLTFSELATCVKFDLKKTIEDGKIDLYVQRLMENGTVIDHQEM